MKTNTGCQCIGFWPLILIKPKDSANVSSQLALETHDASTYLYGEVHENIFTSDVQTCIFFLVSNRFNWIELGLDHACQTNCVLHKHKLH